MAQVKIGVVGAGVIGLASAVNIQRAIPNVQVTIIADKFSTDTTSDGAGGIFRPTSEHVKGVPADTLKQWVRDSADHFMKIASSKDAGKCGVFPITGYHFLNHETNPVYASFINRFHKLSQDELRKLNSTYSHGYAATSLIVEPGKYMPVLMREFKENGGQTELRTVQSLEELVGHYDVVVNCSGLGSRWLVNDHKVYAVRGQLIKIKAPWIKSWIYTDDDAYIIPRSDDVVIGGVRQINNYSTEISEKDKQGILDRCAKLLPSVKEAEILSEWVGLRPNREPIRLEAENMEFKSGNLMVVHNYGHGGNGISLSWGTGVQVTKLVKECLEKRQLKSHL